MLRISDICLIKNNLIIKNNEIVFCLPPELEEMSLLDQYYKTQINNYPKYYKMDRLSKLAFIASEVLLSGSNVKEKYSSDEIAIVLNNSSSSLDTDENYYETIKNKNEFFPSPALFVYTLPNIMIGEICIRNKICGESILTVSNSADYTSIVDNVELIFETSQTKCCLAGYVEYTKNNSEAFLCTVEFTDDLSDDRLSLNNENLRNILENTKGI